MSDAGKRPTPFTAYSAYVDAGTVTKARIADAYAPLHHAKRSRDEQEREDRERRREDREYRIEEREYRTESTRSRRW